MDDVGERPPQLVAWCTLLRWFNHDLLSALGAPDVDIRHLLASDTVVFGAEAPDRLHLREDVRKHVLHHIPVEAEITFHTQALSIFLQRIPDRLTYPTAEDDSLYHLDRLFFLLGPRGQWHILADHIHAVHDSGTSFAASWLLFYEGMIALNTYQYGLAQATLSTLEAEPALDPILRLRVLNGLALTHFYQCRYAPAIELFEVLYALACQEGDLLHQGIALVNSGMVYHDLDHFAIALDRSLRALPCFRAVGDRQRESMTLYEIGNTALRLGRWSIAKQYLVEAITLAEELGLDARLSNLYWAFGLLHHFCGDLVESETAYLRACAIAASPDHPDHRVLTDTYWFLGFLYATQDRWDAALSAYDTALGWANEAEHYHTLCLIQYQRGVLLLRRGDVDAATQALADAIAWIKRLRTITSDDQIKISVLGTTQQVFETMVLLCVDHGHFDDAFHYVERARSRAFLDELLKRDAALADAIDQPIPRLADVQAQLPADVVLIEYFTTGVLPLGEHLLNALPSDHQWLRQYLAPPPHLFIFAVTRDRLVVHRTAFDPNVLRPDPHDPIAGRHLLQEWLLPALYQELVSPIADLLDGCRLLYIIPHGPLHYVPFAALHDGQGQALLSETGPVLALAPSATILLRQCLNPTRRGGQMGLAIGWNGSSEPILAYAEAEAWLVGCLMDAPVWSGPEPKSAALAQVAPDLRWLHLACHAVFNLDSPLDSCLRLGEGDELTAQHMIRQLRLPADLVSLSACVTGLSRVVPGDELLGLPRALLYAGAATIVCSLWEVDDLVSLLVMYGFYEQLHAGTPPGTALRDVMLQVRSMTGRAVQARVAAISEACEDASIRIPIPHIDDDDLDRAIFADPWYWAAFTLIGRSD